MARTRRGRSRRRTVDRVWGRLLKGEFTEVFVFGGRPGVTLPHTLGLEPILSEAYRYKPDGTLRSRDELAQTAEDLANGKRWISTGLRPEWASAFMDRAQVIVFYDTRWIKALPPSPPTRPGGAAPVPPLTRYVRYRLAQARSRDVTLGGAYWALSEPLWDTWKRDEVSALARFARNEYRDKFVHVTSRKQARLLQRVRAR